VQAEGALSASVVPQGMRTQILVVHPGITPCFVVPCSHAVQFPATKPCRDEPQSVRAHITERYCLVLLLLKLGVLTQLVLALCITLVELSARAVTSVSNPAQYVSVPPVAIGAAWLHVSGHGAVCVCTCRATSHQALQDSQGCIVCMRDVTHPVCVGQRECLGTTM
jgi:hypothetical protein